MKTPDEIKKALECCFYDSAQCGECPYYPVSCDRELVRDAREYIRQLEAERDAAIADMTEMARSVGESVCEWCDQTECECTCAEIGIYAGFNWRGVQKEDSDA